MKFSIRRESLLKPLQMVTGVVEKRHTLPVLSNLLVTCKQETLNLTGTDLEVELRSKVPLDGAEDGEVTVPARKFMDICRTLPEEAVIEFRLDGDRAVIRSGRSRFALATLPATDFPATDAVDSGQEFELSQGALRKLIEQTQFAMANQDVRYYLNGLLLELRASEVRAVATDGHRLALGEMPLQNGSGEEQQVIVPRKGVVELMRLLSDTDDSCQVRLDPNYIQVTVAGSTLTSKLIDGRFPDYERVIPQEGNKRVVADRELLRQALVRTSILSNEKYRGIRLHFSGSTLRATVNNPEQEEAVEEIEIDFQGEEFEIGFNVAYLLDALNAVRQDEVQLSMMDSNSSCLIHGVGDTSSRYVVMPMRL